MDGAYVGSRDIAFHKAQTAALFPFPSRFFQELAFGKDLKGGMVPRIAYTPNLTAFSRRIMAPTTAEDLSVPALVERPPAT
jgi:uncharacterized protein GlcG (DUF336 family)